MVARTVVLTALLALFGAVLPRSSQAQVLRVWSVDDGRKIGLDESGPVEPYAADLFGMRNETLSFQIVVQAGAKGARVSLRSEGLGLARLRLFREDYVKVASRSHGLVWKPGSRAEPAGILGMVPDRLVPLEQGARVDVAASQNQVFWVDLWIPPGTPAGLLSGRIIVDANAGCEVGCEAAVTVELLDRDMPDEMRARSMVWFSASDLGDDRVSARYFADPASASDEAKAALKLRHYQLAREHRISLIGQHEAIDAELDLLLSGRAFSEEMGYRGPGQGRGLDVLALHAYGGELRPDEAEVLLAKSKSYPDVRDAFVYVMDEPEKEQWGEINRRADASRPMPSLVTTMYTSKLNIDIFALLASMYSRKNAEKGRAAGKTIWIYNGERPFTGSFAIDDVAVAPRVNPWIQYKLAIPRWFYWEATYYYDFQGKRGAVDIGRDALNFTNRHGDRVNGDGLLMYPGRDLVFPESDVGIDGPVPSIRLKNWRRGIEDVEYLVMAREAGYGAEVDELLEKLLPRIVDQVGASDAVGFPEDGKAWRDARRYLFEILQDGRSNVQVPNAPEPTKPPSANRWWMWALAGGALLALLALLGVRKRAASR